MFGLRPRNPLAIFVFVCHVNFTRHLDILVCSTQIVYLYVTENSRERLMKIYQMFEERSGSVVGCML